MRVLIVSAVFPPYASIGSTRVGKAARYLIESGHDVRVLTADGHALPRTAPPEIDPAHVVATRAPSLHRPSELVQGGRAAVIAAGGRRMGAPWSLLHRVWRLWTAVAYVPDYLVLWYPFAVRAGARLIEAWRPDVILASGLPPTAYLIARSLARRFALPWVAELRDLWVDNPTYAFPGWRRALDRRIERSVLGDAAALVTVAEPFAASLRARFRAPVTVVANGFDPDDLPAGVGRPVTTPGVSVVYTGTLYPERHGHARLFEAVRGLDADLARDLRLVFVGRLCGEAARAARAAGVEHVVEAMPPVPYAEALAAQAAADVLLLLTFTGEAGLGYHHAKIYEYIAARRPILVIGRPDGEAGRLVALHGLGRVADEPAAIAGFLAAWIAEKRALGQIAPTPPDAAAPFTRRAQTLKLEAVLAGVAHAPSMLREPASLGYSPPLRDVSDRQP